MRRLQSCLLALVSLSLVGGCPVKQADPTFHFALPLDDQLSLAGNVPVELSPASLVKKGILTVTLDGQDVSDHFQPNGKGDLPSGEGPHELVATLQVNGEVHQTTRHYETILVTEFFACAGLSDEECWELNAQVAEECEILNRVECMLPYPSAKFLAPGAPTPTTFQLDVPQRGLPTVRGTPVPASMINTVDGFSPTVQILTHFLPAVDPFASGLSRLIPPCVGTGAADPECNPNGGPPWVDMRTHDARSLDPDHPTVLMTWDGERILHWAENDAVPFVFGRQSFIIRPAQSLIPGERYIVAIRNLVDVFGEPIVAEPAFAALRDERHTDIPQLVERRKAMEKVFKQLGRAGVERDDLLLAFEFTVQSDHSLTHQMLAIRDQSLQWLDEQTQPTFVVDDDPDDPSSLDPTLCTSPDQPIWKVVEGRFTVPLFLGNPPLNDTVDEHTVDANDVPVQNGVWDDAPFHVAIPCLLHPTRGDPDADTHTLLLGHGIFGTGESMVRGIPEAAARVLDFWRDPPPASGLQPRPTPRLDYVAGATDWSGWNSSDFIWVGGAIIGLVNSNLHRFPAFPDRHRQGQANTLVLSRMLKRGLFNSHPAFQDGNGNGVLPVPSEDPDSGHYYYGISMGGVQGLFHAAISTDIEKFGIDVGSMNFSFLLFRSTQFNTTDPTDADFRSLLGNIGIQDPMDVLVGVTLLHELWVSADPAGYMTHVTDPSNLLPGNDFPKKLYMSPAWLDYQVSNHGTEMTARTLGVPSGPGSLQKGLVGIPDEPPGAALDSALIMWDTGLHDILEAGDEPGIPPLAPRVVSVPDGDPHGARPFIPATLQTLATFLRPGGEIENFCDDDGLCNASQPWECEAGIDGAGNVSAGCPTP